MEIYNKSIKTKLSKCYKYVYEIYYACIFNTSIWRVIVVSHKVVIEKNNSSRIPTDTI